MSKSGLNTFEGESSKKRKYSDSSTDENEVKLKSSKKEKKAKKKKRESSSPARSSDLEHKVKKHEMKKHKKKLKKEKKKKKDKDRKKSPISIGPEIPEELKQKSRSMAPMTKEEWEKKQNVIKRVYDAETGRHRLIKGSGEVLEEIVSRDMHKQINKQATIGDGEFFQTKLSNNLS